MKYGIYSEKMIDDEKIFIINRLLNSTIIAIDSIKTQAIVFFLADAILADIIYKYQGAVFLFSATTSLRKKDGLSSFFL